MVSTDTIGRTLGAVAAPAVLAAGALLLSLAVPALAADEEIHFVIQPEFKYVSYGSLVKLRNTEIPYELNTMHANYPQTGSSSGQQAVTAVSVEKGGQLFIVEEAFNTTVKPRGTPVQCGSEVRLFHRETETHLHSHSNHVAFISGYQEVSAFGVPDAGDNWVLECLESDPKAPIEGSSDYWVREHPIALRHKDTNMYMMTGKTYEYETVIAGHLEIFGYKSQVSGSSWKATEGIYYEVDEDTLKKTSDTSDNVRDDL